MRDALEDLGSAHAPHLASSRALHLAHDPAVVVHPLARDAGARRAVLVGINYAAIGGSARLKRREGDVRWAHDTLSERGFDDPDGTRVLVDDGHDTGQPTRKNLMRAIAWLVKGAAPGDSLLFHFSGRASLPGVGPERSSKSRTPRGDPDAVAFSSLEGDSAEFDLDAESSRPALAAMDSDKNGCVTRGELHAALVRPLPRGVRLTVIIDVPDEGGAGCLQLPYAYDVVGDGEEVLTFTANEMCCVCKDPIYIKSKVTESVCVDTNDMEEAITACTAECDKVGCGCVAVSVSDPEQECPKARCALAMDPGTYTVGSWGKTNYDGRSYRSYNNKATPRLHNPGCSWRHICVR